MLNCGFFISQAKKFNTIKFMLKKLLVNYFYNFFFSANKQLLYIQSRIKQKKKYKNTTFISLIIIIIYLKKKNFFIYLFVFFVGCSPFLWKPHSTISLNANLECSCELPFTKVFKLL